MKPKIVVVENYKFFPDQKKRLDALGDVTYYPDVLKSAAEWLKRARGHEIICTGRFGFCTDKLYELENVFISAGIVGVEFLDQRKLKERNIAVANSPGCNKEAVAEWIVGMMLMFFRRLNRLTGVQDLTKEEVLETATSVYGKKITILGAGNIGKRLQEICESLGMEASFFLGILRFWQRRILPGTRILSAGNQMI